MNAVGFTIGLLIVAGAIQSVSWDAWQWGLLLIGLLVFGGGSSYE